MFPIMNILAALPWRFIGVGAVIFMLFVGGYQYGEKRGEQHVMTRWDAEKAATAQVVARQAEQVAALIAQQSTINQEISNDFQKAKATFAAERDHMFDRAAPSFARGMRNDSAEGSAFDVPIVPAIAAGIAAVSTDALPDSPGLATGISCEQLARDAAETTLMVLELQQWHARQSAADGTPAP